MLSWSTPQVTCKRPVSCFRSLVQFLNCGCFWSLQLELVV